MAISGAGRSRDLPPPGGPWPSVFRCQRGWPPAVDAGSPLGAARLSFRRPLRVSLSRVMGSPFVRSVGILTAGTALARVIPMAVSPVLTRVYTPRDFGIAAVAMAMSSAVLPAVGGKYEIALVLPKSDAEGVHLLGVAIGITGVISTALGLALVVGRGTLLALLRVPELGPWVFAFPFALFFTGTMTAMTYYANRRAEYWTISKSQMISSLTTAVVAIGLGVAHVGFPGLLVAWVAGAATSSAFLLAHFRRDLAGPLWRDWSIKRSLMRRYSSFPAYNATSGLLNGFADSVPTFFLTRYFSGAVVGYYSLMTRVVNTPASFLATSVSQVNLKKVVDLINEGREVRPYLRSVTLGLAAMASGPALILMFFGEPIFAWVFGSEWAIAGQLMQIMVPALALRFVVSTLSTTLGATQHNRLGAGWKVGAFLVTASVYSALAPAGDLFGLFRVVVVADIASYAAYLAVIWYAAGHAVVAENAGHA